ncbi:Transmembrane protein [Phytophthora megakarya]|uniref:Transmembrane protein n=1 Tax=Phytophthora megakarya TaxID=4795 RepID=A0A225VJ11_9STRA|nr:Transmembrane protein [Phytophthora megakarya]
MSTEERVALRSAGPSSSSLTSPSRARLLATAGVGSGPAAPDEAHAVRLNVLNSSVQEARDARNSRLIMWAISLVNLPQIVVAAVILGLHWQGETLCYRIQVWVLLHTIHLTLTLLLEWTLYYLNGARSNSAIRLREQYMAPLSQLKYGLDLAGLFWFLVGNMWVISDGARCDDGSAMYQLALWMIVISYAKIFLPCLLLLALLPILCFCLPCVIRLLSRLQDPMRGKGATKELIDQLETKTYTVNMFPPEDACCCICLNDYEPSQSLRLLPCGHHFHKECVDEWLLVNSTCPTCRKSIFDTGSAAVTATSEEDMLRRV